MQVSKAPSFTPRRFGKYLLLERIGRGGMAEVYRSKTFGAAGFVKECAIKKILTSLLDDEQFVRMFVDEAKLTSYLTHPNIVQVLDLGEIDGHLFIAMEYVAGKDLLDLLARSARRGIRIPVELTLYIATEMLKGLHYAHGALDAKSNEMNIVHRDVSPSNILLSYDGQVKVGDFGIAKSQMQSSRTEVGTQKGKTGYMSPEQVTGATIDHRSDLFAAAVIIFEMLTMTRLFKAKNDLEVMLKIRDGDIEEDLERARRISPGLAAIIGRGLAKDPDERFQSGAEFLEELRDYIQDRKIKVGAHALSAYISELFADKIEAERARRQEDPDQGEGFESVANANESLFRYRDPDGVIHGPMRSAMMSELLGSRPPNGRETISFSGGAWRPVDTFSEFADVLRPNAQLADSSEMSGLGLRMTQGVHDWESLAGVNRNAKRRMRSRKSQHDASAFDSGAVPRMRRDPRRKDTRETAIVESGSAVHRLPEHQTRPRRRSSDSSTAPRSVLARTPITKRPASEVRKALEGSAAAAAADAVRRHSTTSEAAVVRDQATPIATQAVYERSATPTGRPTGEVHPIGEGLEYSPDEVVEYVPPRPRSVSTEQVEVASDGRPVVRSRSRSISVSGSIPAAGVVRPRRISANQPSAEPAPSQVEVELIREEAVSEAGDATVFGELGEITVFRLAHRLAQAGSSGRLEVSDGVVTKSFYFADGALVAADSTDANDALIEILRSKEVISRQDAQAALDAVDAGARSVEDALLTGGAIAPHALFHFMQEQLAEKLLACLFWEHGTWAWWDGARFESDAYPTTVDVDGLLARGVNEGAESRYLRRLYKTRRRTPLVALRGAEDYAALKLSARAVRVGTNLDSTRTVADVIGTYCDRYNWPEAEVYRVIFMLTEYEVVGFEGADDIALPG